MNRKRRMTQTYEYSCTITGEVFKTTRPAPHPNELVSVKAYYELHSENDDRPESIKKQLQQEEEYKNSLASMGPDTPNNGA